MVSLQKHDAFVLENLVASGEQLILNQITAFNSKWSYTEIEHMIRGRSYFGFSWKRFCAVWRRGRPFRGQAEELLGVPCSGFENWSQSRIDHNWELILIESSSGLIFRYLVKNVENIWRSSNQSFRRYWLLKFNPSVARYWDGFQTSPGRRGRGERISILGGNRLSHWSNGIKERLGFTTM